MNKEITTIEATLPADSIIKTILELGTIDNGEESVNEIDNVKSVPFTLSSEDYNKMIGEFLRQQEEETPKRKLQRAIRRKALLRKRNQSLMN